MCYVDLTADRTVDCVRLLPVVLVSWVQFLPRAPGYFFIFFAIAPRLRCLCTSAVLRKEAVDGLVGLVTVM